MTASQVAAILARQAETVAAHLLPNGKLAGSHWCAGSVDGEPGESLKVLIRGTKAGQWADFATDAHHGDLLDLWAWTRCAGDVGQALKEAREYLGIREMPLKPKEYRRPERPKARKVAGSALDELRSRGISQDAIDRYQIADTGREIVFPSLRGGELVALKYRAIGEKRFRQEAGQEPCLFGWQAIPAKARAVVICEGEIDALSWATWGIPALSVPMGGGDGNKQSWIDSEYDHLERFDEIFLSLDADDVGRRGMLEISRRIGAERCRVVDLGHKDANAALQAGVTQEQAWDALTNAKSLDPAELRDASEYADAVVEELLGNVHDNGWLPPWQSVEDLIRFRPGETIILAGETGHGKSRIAGWLTAYALAQGAKCCVASMEFKPPRWLRDMTRQIAAVEQPSESFARYVQDWYSGKLWVFNPDGKTRAERLLEVFAYARKRYAVDWFVIDNLSKCGIADDDYPGQKAFVDSVSEFDRDMGCTTFVLHHMRKGVDGAENQERGRSAIKGSGGIMDMADTVLTVWRNKPKERALEIGKDAEKYEDQPDSTLTCTKQRETGKEPRIALWFDRPTGQYLKCSKHRPRPLIRYTTVKPSGDAHGGENG